MTLLLPVLVLLAGFAVNFAYMDLIRTETFVAADAATRAGGRTFALTGDLDAAKANAREAAQRNPIAGKALVLADADFVLGRSVRGGNTAGSGANGNGNAASNIGSGSGYAHNPPTNGGISSPGSPSAGNPSAGAGTRPKAPTGTTPPPPPPASSPIARPKPPYAPGPGGSYFPWPTR